jgi:hypothetical protein
VRLTFLFCVVSCHFGPGLGCLSRGVLTFNFRAVVQKKSSEGIAWLSILLACVSTTCNTFNILLVRWNLVQVRATHVCLNLQTKGSDSDMGLL